MDADARSRGVDGVGRSGVSRTRSTMLIRKWSISSRNIASGWTRSSRRARGGSARRGRRRSPSRRRVVARSSAVAARTRSPHVSHALTAGKHDGRRGLGPGRGRGTAETTPRSGGRRARRSRSLADRRRPPASSPSAGPWQRPSAGRARAGSSRRRRPARRRAAPPAAGRLAPGLAEHDVGRPHSARVGLGRLGVPDEQQTRRLGQYERRGGEERAVSVTSVVAPRRSPVTPPSQWRTRADHAAGERRRRGERSRPSHRPAARATATASGTATAAAVRGTRSRHRAPSPRRASGASAASDDRPGPRDRSGGDGGRAPRRRRHERREHGGLDEEVERERRGAVRADRVVAHDRERSLARGSPSASAVSARPSRWSAPVSSAPSGERDRRPRRAAAEDVHEPDGDPPTSGADARADEREHAARPRATSASSRTTSRPTGSRVRNATAAAALRSPSAARIGDAGRRRRSPSRPGSRARPYERASRARRRSPRRAAGRGRAAARARARRARAR